MGSWSTTTRFFRIPTKSRKITGAILLCFAASRIYVLQLAECFADISSGSLSRFSESSSLTLLAAPACLFTCKTGHVKAWHGSSNLDRVGSQKTGSCALVSTRILPSPSRPSPICCWMRKWHSSCALGYGLRRVGVGDLGERGFLLCSTAINMPGMGSSRCTTFQKFRGTVWMWTASSWWS